jgi:caffeoyl-CoA O-methyltransferase
MEFIAADLAAYADAHTSPESAVLQQLNRDTHAHILYARMLSGHLQGRLLAMLSQMIRPRRILEIGTYTGYSALCLAEGLQPDGELITLEKNEELEGFIRRHWADTPHEHQLDLHLGPAADLIPTLEGEFDLIFIDADKRSNALYYDLVFEKLRPGGFLLVDNVLWSGKVVQPVAPADQDTQAVLAFNKKIHDDPRVDNVLLPVRDGLLLVRKR